MRTLAALVVFVVLFQGIKPRPRNGTARLSSIKSTRRNYDLDSDDDFSINDSSDDSDSDDDDSYSYSRTSNTGCPLINQIIGCNGISATCINGILYINGEAINAKSTDRVDVISNELRINGKFIRRIPPNGKNTNSIVHIGNITGGNVGTGNGCPGVTKIGCTNVFTSCTNGKFYINGERTNVKSTDRVEIISNNLSINGKFIRYIPPSWNYNSVQHNAEDEDEENVESDGIIYNDNAEDDDEEDEEDEEDEDGDEEDEEDDNGDEEEEEEDNGDEEEDDDDEEEEVGEDSEEDGDDEEGDDGENDEDEDDDDEEDGDGDEEEDDD